MHSTLRGIFRKMKINRFGPSNGRRLTTTTMQSKGPLAASRKTPTVMVERNECHHEVESTNKPAQHQWKNKEAGAVGSPGQWRRKQQDPTDLRPLVQTPKRINSVLSPPDPTSTNRCLLFLPHRSVPSSPATGWLSLSPH